jgi:hypothetical protein
MSREEPEIVGEITEIETIAINTSIRDLAQLKRQFGGERWRKLKGIAHVMKHGRVVLAEVHWYECHGIGRCRMKVKRYLEET